MLTFMMLMKDSGKRLTPMAHSANNECFGCGVTNPAGLHLEFFLTEDHSVVSMPVVPRAFDGHPGYLHGGIIATLLDEAMSKSVRARGSVAMTRHMEVDYLRPVPSGVPVRIEARVTHHEGRKRWSEARIVNADGTVLAQSKGLFVEIATERLSSEAAARTATRAARMIATRAAAKPPRS
jgi:uncharacterized protein (TIGR00369 family)